MNAMAVTMAHAQAEAQSVPADDDEAISEEEIEALVREAILQGRRDTANVASQ